MTEKYKSLLYREWKVSKKFYLLRIVLILLFTLMLGGVMIYWSTGAVGTLVIEGETVPATEGPMDVTFIFLFYLLVLFMAAASGEDNGVYKSDVNSGWLKFSWALPVTAHEKAVTRFSFRGIVVLIGTLYMFASIGVICGITGFAHMKTVVYAFFWCLDFCLLLDTIKDFVIMRAVDMKAVKKMGNIALVVIIVAIELPYFMKAIQGTPPEDILEGKMMTMIKNNDFSGLTELITIPDLWGWVGILLLFVILIGGFLLSRKNFERRNA